MTRSPHTRSAIPHGVDLRPAPPARQPPPRSRSSPTLPRLLSPALAALLLTGCVVGPDFHRPAQKTPATWRHQPQPPAPAQPLQANWWAPFQDPTLDELLHRALAANQDLKKAVALVDETRSRLGMAKSDLVPSLGLGQSYERSRNSRNGAQGQILAGGLIPPEQNRHRATLDGSYELDLWGRVRRTVESAAAQSAAAEAAASTVLLHLTAEVAENYLSLRALDAEIAVLQRTADLRERALTITRSRVQSGIALPADVTRAETELENVRSDLRETERRRALLLNGLAVLCGEPAPTFHVELHPPTLPPVPEVPPGLPSELLLRRPDIAEAEFTAASRCAEVGVAKAAFLPSVKLTGSAGLESLELKDLFTWQSRIWAAGPNVSLPVFAGGRNRASLRAAQARYEQAVAVYRQSVLGAFRDVENALANSRAYAERGETLQRAETSARRTVDWFEQRLEGGMIAYLDMLDAQRTLLQAQRASLQNLGSRYIASIQLIKALGGGWSQAQLTAR